MLNNELEFIRHAIVYGITYNHNIQQWTRAFHNNHTKLGKIDQKGSIFLPISSKIYGGSMQHFHFDEGIQLMGYVKKKKLLGVAAFSIISYLN